MVRGRLGGERRGRQHERSEADEQDELSHWFSNHV
jgi:hypothetical protein